MTAFLLPPTARPHTIVPAANGDIWYTGNANATVGKRDPTTGEVTEYQTQARDPPHTAAFHPDGRLYFTNVSEEGLRDRGVFDAYVDVRDLQSR